MRLHSIRHSQSGVASVEFALVALVFFTMVFGIIDMGRVFWLLSSMEYAVEGAGRYAMVNPSATSAQVIAQGQANLYGISRSAVTFTTANSSSGSVTFMTIKAQSSFNFLPSHLFNYGTINLVRTATVPIF